MNYFLTSTRLGFRCWHEEDLSLAIELWSDPEVTSLIGGPLAAEMVHQRLDTEISHMHEHGVQYWPFFLLDGDQHVGCAGLRPYDLHHRVYELGFHLRRAFWKKGLAEEAARAMTSFAFGWLGATALFAGHHPANVASAGLLRKLGFVYTHDEFYPPTGLNHPSYLLHRP